MQLTIHTKSYTSQKWEKYIEPVFLILSWGLYFLCINVNWTKAWIAESFLPESVAPHCAIAFPLIFFTNVYWLIPKYLNRKKWYLYLIISLGLLLLFEISRALIFYFGLSLYSFKSELVGENSLILGKLNFLTTNVIFWSFLFRFTRDWFFNKTLISHLQEKNIELLNNSQSVKLKTDNIYRESFNIKKRNENIILKTGDIIYFKAKGDFVLASDIEGKKHIINSSLKQIYCQLNPNTFFQINRGEIINFDFYKAYKPYIKNRLEIHLINTDSVLYTSNSRTPQFRIWLNRT